jgi:hypothetical protein
LATEYRVNRWVNVTRGRCALGIDSDSTVNVRFGSKADIRAT